MILIVRTCILYCILLLGRKLHIFKCRLRIFCATYNNFLIYGYKSISSILSEIYIKKLYYFNTLHDLNIKISKRKTSCQHMDGHIIKKNKVVLESLESISNSVLYFLWQADKVTVVYPMRFNDSIDNVLALSFLEVNHFCFLKFSD